MEEPRYILGGDQFVNDDDALDLGWGFEYPVSLVKLGYRLWKASGHTVIPEPETLIRLKEWISDLETAHVIVEHKRPKKKKDD